MNAQFLVTRGGAVHEILYTSSDIRSRRKVEQTCLRVCKNVVPWYGLQIEIG